MAFFDNLTTSLKQKWLQFFQGNRSWITRYMEVESVYTPDGGRRPPSYLILGVVNALEPQLPEMMLPFSKLNPDADALIEVLELNFDPDLVLGNRFNPAVNPEEPDAGDIFPEEVLLRSNALYPEEVVLVESDDESIVVLSVDEPDAFVDMSLDDMADAMGLEESDDESIVVLNVALPETFGDMSLDEIADAMGLEESDDELLQTPSATQPDTFSDDMSLDEIADAMGLEESDDELLQTPSATQSDELGDVLSDAWGEETSSESDKTDDEKHSEHDQEISRLFPNS